MPNRKLNGRLFHIGKPVGSPWLRPIPVLPSIYKHYRYVNKILTTLSNRINCSKIRQRYYFFTQHCLCRFWLRQGMPLPLHSKSGVQKTNPPYGYHRTEDFSLSKKREWSGKLHKEVLFADANEPPIKAWKILTRHFASKMTARGHPRRVCTS